MIYGSQISNECFGLVLFFFVFWNKKNHLFYLCETGMFILVPNMLLQTWLLLLFCEAVVYIKL